MKDSRQGEGQGADRVVSSTGRVWNHTILDRRDEVAIEILIADIDGDGNDDIVSGSRWYRAPLWDGEEIPGISQAVAVLDVDEDGQLEVIGVRGPGLTSDFCWAKRTAEGWRVYAIGVGGGDWPHGVTMIRTSGGARAMVTSYHERGLHPPQIWTIPDDPTEAWPVTTLLDLAHSEELLRADIDGDGLDEIVAGPWLLKETSKGWTARRFADDTYENVSRVRVGDLLGRGRRDIVITEETGDWETRDPGSGRVSVFEAPADPDVEGWTERVIARMKCPHSLDLIARPGDSIKIIVAEHDVFTADGEPINAALSIFSCDGAEWVEERIDTRFEHFNGAKVIDVGGDLGIASHGWLPPHDLHLWTTG